MKRGVSYGAKAVIGFFIALDWWNFSTFEYRSSPLNTFNAVGFFQRLPFLIAYLAWVLWPLRGLAFRQTAAAEPEPDRPDARTAMVGRHLLDVYAEPTDEERATWISETPSHNDSES